jgi:hypothetical protein
MPPLNPFLKGLPFNLSIEKDPLFKKVPFTQWFGWRKGLLRKTYNAHFPGPVTSFIIIHRLFGPVDAISHIIGIPNHKVGVCPNMQEV